MNNKASVPKLKVPLTDKQCMEYGDARHELYATRKKFFAQNPNATEKDYISSNGFKHANDVLKRLCDGHGI